MQLIDEIEVSYFRSFYKQKLKSLKDLNVVFGGNDAGKSNIVRALNLFFSGAPDHTQDFEFPIDFNEYRRSESEQNEDVRKFLYVKITFNTPASFQKSLGVKFSVKRQWTVSRGDEYIEEFSKNIAANKRHIAARFLNKIRFIHIPAIKDTSIFEMLLGQIHETIADSEAFSSSVEKFSKNLQKITKNMFSDLPNEISYNSSIGAPTQLSQLFQTLDFETMDRREEVPKSLIRQRGDGVKVRHIPELLSFISENDNYDFHIWGFEEPENSLEFSAAQAEASRFLKLGETKNTQIITTSHSPSFYLLDSPNVSKSFVRKDRNGNSLILQEKELSYLDAYEAMGDGFYLPAVAGALAKISSLQLENETARVQIEALKEELSNISRPVLLTEGKTDALIIISAWEKLRGTDLPFEVRSCETIVETGKGGNGGADNLAIRLKGIASDSPNLIIGLFDYDEKGISAFKLDRNFDPIDSHLGEVKRSKSGKAMAALLPMPHFRSECFEFKNLPIEYLFPDEVILNDYGGLGLVFEVMKMSRTVAGKKFEQKLDNLTHFKNIISGKMSFATQVVPLLPVENFEGFSPLLSLLDELFKDT